MENVAPVSKQEKQSMGMVGGGKRTHQPRYQTRVAGIIDQNQAQKEVAAARHDRGSKVQSLSRNKAIQEFGSTVFAPPKPVVTRESRKNKHERLW